MASPASADQLSSLKAQAQGVASQIDSLGKQEEALAEQYDGAQVRLQGDQRKVAAAAKAVTSANAAANKAKGVLKTEAVNAYVHNGSAGASSAGDNTLGNANSSLLRAEYVSSLATNQSDAKDAYHLASVQAQTAKENLQAAQADAQKQVDTLSSDRQQVSASQNKLEGVYHQETSQIATLVAQIEAQKEAAAQAAATAAANARAAAAQAAAAAQQQQAQATQNSHTAAAVTPIASPVADASPAATTAPSTTTTAPSDPSGGATTPTTAAPTATTAPATPTVAVAPSSNVGAAAVAAAETQLGVPYVWGGSTPGVGFDCSGLVMWAYGQVGVSLPHYSGSQFSDGVQISMSQLQPGDLVFFADTGEHVAMYVGGGDIIEAPQTGQTVHIVPMYSEFVLAVRIA